MTPDLFVGVSIAMFAIIIYSAVTISEYKAKNRSENCRFKSEFYQSIGNSRHHSNRDERFY